MYQYIFWEIEGMLYFKFSHNYIIGYSVKYNCIQFFPVNFLTLKPDTLIFSRSQKSNLILFDLRIQNFCYISISHTIWNAKFDTSNCFSHYFARKQNWNQIIKKTIDKAQPPPPQGLKLLLTLFLPENNIEIKL